MSNKRDPERIVTTFFGKKAKRKDCRYIKENFYKINEECFNFNGRWYRINSGFLIQDFETKEWLLKEGADVINGLVYDPEEGVTTGYFKYNPLRNVPVHTRGLPESLSFSSLGKVVHALDEQVVQHLGFVEDISTGVYMNKRYATNKISIGGNYAFPVDYSFETTGGEIKETFKEIYKSLRPKSKYAELLKGVTFGWEFETSDGFVHPRYLRKTGLIPVRDGSIEGYEYVSCPMGGAKGLDITLKIADVLSKFTSKNAMCALHLHIGNFKRTEEDLVRLWKVVTSLEEDMYSMFPALMKKTSSYKARDYTRPLPKFANFSKIDSESIIDWIAGESGYYRHNFRGIGTKRHPREEDGRKWNNEQRYLWCNFVPYIFSDRGTVEFRIHTPTSNPIKLINWLFICSGIVNFAIDYAANYSDDHLQELTLDRVMKVVYPREVSTYLCKYIDLRKDIVKKMTAMGDYIGNFEIGSDLEFSMNFNGKRTLVE